MSILRWLFAIASIPAGVLISVALVFFIGGVGNKFFPESGLMFFLTTALASAIGAFITVYTPAKLAPQFKPEVALSSYSIGAVSALIFTAPLASLLFAPFLVAVLSGYITYRHIRSSTRQKSS